MSNPDLSATTTSVGPTRRGTVLVDPWSRLRPKLLPEKAHLASEPERRWIYRALYWATKRSGEEDKGSAGSQKFLSDIGEVLDVLEDEAYVLDSGLQRIEREDEAHNTWVAETLKRLKPVEESNPGFHIELCPGSESVPVGGNVETEATANSVNSGATDERSV